MRRVAMVLALLGVAATPALGQPTREEKLAHELTLERAHHRHDIRRMGRRARGLSRHLHRLRAGYTFTTTDTVKAAELVGMVVGWPVAQALRVARCESHLQPWARNSTLLSGSGAAGSWQTLYNPDGRRSSTWHSTDVGRALPDLGDVLNPYVNAFVAWRVWQRNGGTFREWADVCARA